jgi:hypothetical protein
MKPLKGIHVLPVAGLFLFLLFLAAFGLAQQPEPSEKIAAEKTDSALYRFLTTLPGATIKPVTYRHLTMETYEVRLDQPLDHDRPDGKTFPQRIYVSHADTAKPVVFVTAGYGVGRPYPSELTRILKCNQIQVEHRYFRESVPDSMDWSLLTVKQAAADHHRIIELFKPFYKGKWISTGVSKGGQTACYHRWLYPGDVAATVPYVAPLNFSQTDPRIYTFLDTVGTAECRKKIRAFQTLVLQRRDEMLTRFKWYSRGHRYTYPIGEELTFEYAVLEYSFSYWQNGRGMKGCGTIPGEGASSDSLFEHLLRNVPFSLYAKQSVEGLWPAMYQFAKELGYYGFDTAPFKGLLKAIPPKPDHLRFAPEETDLTYVPETNEAMNRWLQKEGDRFIFIYGGADTWSATQVQLTGETDALKMVKKDGNHGTRIRSFSKEAQEKIFTTLERWLEMELPRPQENQR